MKKRLALMAVVLFLIFGGAIGFKLFKQSMIRDYLDNMGTPAVPLNAAVVTAEQWDQRLAAIGSLRARKGIEMRSEANGVIEKVYAESGARVDAGELLLTVDDTVEQATLKSAKVRLETARRDFRRDQTLFERKLISEDEFENSRSERESAEALVEETQGIIARKTLRAPFAGTVGIHSLAEGHYLGQGDEILSLQALDTLYLDMQLPEKELKRLKVGQQVQFSVPSHGKRQFSAQVRVIDVRVKSTTRNILVRAVVDNADGALLPGMFAKASIILDEARPVLTLPREAVAYSLYGETVYRLEKSETSETGDSSTGWQARRQRVSTGESRGARVVVEGVAEGTWVARDTQNRLLEGAPVKIANLAELTQNDRPESP